MAILKKTSKTRYHEESIKVVGCKLPLAECEAVRAAAEREGKSVNAWLQDVVRAALGTGHANAA